MKRRSFLVGSGAFLLAGLTGCGGSNTDDGSAAGGTGDGYRPLAIPPLLDGTPDASGVKEYILDLQAGSTRFLNGVDTPTWGINGAFLGPAVRLRQGDRVRLHVTNQLSEPTTLHWHGMKVPGPMDGGPHQLIAPDETWVAEFDVLQGASMNWFHPHKEGVTGRHVYMGLAGLMLVEDGVSDGLGLPADWGVDDIPLILQDRRFNADGSFDYNLSNMEAMRGFLGDRYLVNGTLDAGIQVPAREIRLRLLNGSNAREYDLAFSDGRRFRLIATDGGLLEQAVSLTRLRLTPGERAEILVDLADAAGGMLTLVNQADQNAPLLQMDVQPDPANVVRVPDSLTTLSRLDPASASLRRFDLGMRRGQFTINGQSMDMAVINQTVPKGRVEIWEVVNTTNMLHNFHVHGTHFEILDRNGSAAAVEPWEQGFKDTVRLGPNEQVRLLLSFDHYTTTADAPYMFHCHILEHEDRGMMGQFIVV